MVSIKELYKPNRKRLGTLWAGTSGSGKTTAITSTLRQAILSPSFGEYHRFVIVDPKIQHGDYDRLSEPITSLDRCLQSISTERVSLYWPSYEVFDEKVIESDISIIVNEMFTLSDAEPKSSFTFVLDEASIVITPHTVSQSLKRLSVQGRAKGILPVYVSQRPLTNRWLDANLSNLMLFRMTPVDADNLSRRWGLDFSDLDSRIRSKPYSFLRFSLETTDVSYISPVPYPTPRIPRKKKNLVERLRDAFPI